MAAQSIHQNSKRKDAAFIAVNCGATAEWPRESELFGHEKGAFTGAAAQMRKWKIEMDNGGTLVLDEVGDLSMPGQAGFAPAALFTLFGFLAQHRHLLLEICLQLFRPLVFGDRRILS